MDMCARYDLRATLGRTLAILPLFTLRESNIRRTGTWQASRRMRWQVVRSSFLLYLLHVSNQDVEAFITWAKEEVQSYAATFRKQVYSKNVDPKVVEDAIQITHTQSKKVILFRL